MDIESIDCNPKEKNRELHSVVSIQAFLVQAMEDTYTDCIGESICHD